MPCRTAWGGPDRAGGRIPDRTTGTAAPPAISSRDDITPTCVGNRRSCSVVDASCGGPRSADVALALAGLDLGRGGADGVGGVGLALPHGLASADGRVAHGLALELGVDLGAEDHD